MNVTIYLDPDEAAFVRSQGKGYLRKLVQTAMAVEERIAQVREEVSGYTERMVKGPQCKNCGGLVMAGKCLSCGEKQ